MKTLDEVIKALEICSQIDAECCKCPYKSTAKGWCEEKDRDALHYLKEYRDRKETLRNWTEKAISEQQNLSDAITFMQAYRDDKDDLTALRAYWKEQHENNALTWDELKQMEGKPVWATFDNENGTWYIAKVYDDEVVLYEWGQEFGERISGAWDYTPKRWQAYRKERE